MDFIELIVVGSGLFAGLSFLFIGVYLFRRERKLQRRGISAAGIIVGFRYSGRASSPIVEYQTGQGILQACSIYSGKNINTFSKGDKVEIYYDRETPSRIYLVGDRASTVLIVILLFVGIAVLCATAIAFHYAFSMQ
jgi:hypothetical protein